MSYTTNFEINEDKEIITVANADFSGNSRLIIREFNKEDIIIDDVDILQLRDDFPTVRLITSSMHINGVVVSIEDLTPMFTSILIDEMLYEFQDIFDGTIRDYNEILELREKLNGLTNELNTKKETNVNKPDDLLGPLRNEYSEDNIPAGVKADLEDNFSVPIVYEIDSDIDQNTTTLKSNYVRVHSELKRIKVSDENFQITEVSGYETDTFMVRVNIESDKVIIRKVLHAGMTVTKERS